MPVILGMPKGSADIFEEPMVALHPEVLCYMEALRSSTAGAHLRTIARLGALDRYGRTYLNHDEIVQLSREAAELQKLIAERRLPVPPDFVGIEDFKPPGEPFGWDGLSSVAMSLRQLAEQAISSRQVVEAIGD